jgi:hypothetical protein
MLFRQKPREKDKYIKVDSDKTMELHKHGFFPKYFWEGYYYYEKTNELIKYIERW